MMLTRRMIRGVASAAWAILVLGFVAALAPARVPPPRSAPAPVVPAAVPSPAASVPAAGSGVDALLRRNPFDPGRRAPATRWRHGAVDVPAAAADSVMVPAVEPPRLVGIVRAGTAAPAALLQPDPSRPRAALYPEGARAGLFRVRQIGDRTVTLDGPTGRVVLTLRRPGGSP